MRPVTETPTARSDYFVLSGTYFSLLAGVAASGRHREPFALAELVPLSAATFALSKLVVHEKAETWLRAPFLDELPEGGKRPKGRRLRYAIGELMSCTRCIGAWSALGLVGLRLHAPVPGRIVTSVLAVSAGNDLIQAYFTYLCNRADKTQAELAATQDS